jgi:hypothetical protein
VKLVGGNHGLGFEAGIHEYDFWPDLDDRGAEDRTRLDPQLGKTLLEKFSKALCHGSLKPVGRCNRSTTPRPSRIRRRHGVTDDQALLHAWPTQTTRDAQKLNAGPAFAAHAPECH